MYRLTREVRFAFNDHDDQQWDRPPTNSYGGYPSLTGFGRYLALRVTLRGELHPASQYLINIKEIDEAIRTSLRKLSPLVRTSAPAGFLQAIHRAASELWRERLE